MLSKEDLDRLGGFARYKDVDGDGVGYRTLPGTEHPAAAGLRAAADTTRSRNTASVPTITRTTSIAWRASSKTPARWFRARDRSQRRQRDRHHRLRHLASRPGRGARPVAGEYGVKADYLRLKAFRFTREMHDFIAAHKRVYIVDQNRDGADVAAHQTGYRGRRNREAAQRAPLQRAAHRCAFHHRRNHFPGGQVNGDHADTRRRQPKTNRLGLEVLEYRGGKTTLCAGCGHNAISERIIDAFFEMGIAPERVIKMSGIGCSSKSPAYFMSRSHGFNSVHGRMPSVATGAVLANRRSLPSA